MKSDRGPIRVFFATAAAGLEPLVAAELMTLGASDVKESRGGAMFSGTLETAYRACLWLRTANRVLLPLGRFPASTTSQIYDCINRMPWERDVSATGTLAVDFSGTNAAVTNTQFGAQKVKDAIVDRFRQLFNQRPSVDRDRPDLRINCHLHRDVITVSIDLSGESLHMRGYRKKKVLAPLKETLAAALLLKCGWPEIAKRGGSFIDPMCGSGTIVIEAAMIAADMAPGLGRDYWGFRGWTGHDPKLWDVVLGEAFSRKANARRGAPTIIGCDSSALAVLASQENARAAGVAPYVRFLHQAIESGGLNAIGPPGLALTNPPYGERIGTASSLPELYGQIGLWLRTHCLGWRAALIVADPDLGKCLGIRAQKINTFYNGALECKLLQFEVAEKWFMHSI